MWALPLKYVPELVLSTRGGFPLEIGVSFVIRPPAVDDKLGNDKDN
jgi:hypothetical protein